MDDTLTCPVCESDNAYFVILDEEGSHYECPDCGHEWCDDSDGTDDNQNDSGD